MVELHGGMVEAESAGEGHGARFRVRLPIERRSIEHVIRARSIAEPASGESYTAIRGRRILVVEHDDDARAMIAAVLESAGATVVSAASGLEAWQAFIRARPDVLIADIAMPGEDGCGLIRRIRAMAHDEGRSIPAVALTAFARASDRESAVSAGFQRYIVKPVDPRRLVIAVASVL
jgi:CheY-like chemotaxis protein